MNFFSHLPTHPGKSSAELTVDSLMKIKDLICLDVIVYKYR